MFSLCIFMLFEKSQADVSGHKTALCTLDTYALFA
jgi:hypothetical protein